MSTPLLYDEYEEYIEDDGNFESDNRNIAEECFEEYVEDDSNFQRKNRNIAKKERRPTAIRGQPFSQEENETLVDLYLKGRTRYHGKFNSAGRLPGQQTPQECLLNMWAVNISALGFATRTAQQVKQRIWDIRKLASKRKSAERMEFSKTGGGPSDLPDAPEWLNTLMDGLRNDASVSGIEGAWESDDPMLATSSKCDDSVAVDTNERKYQPPKRRVLCELNSMSAPTYKRKKNYTDVGFDHLRDNLYQKENLLVDRKIIIADKIIELLDKIGNIVDFVLNRFA